MEDEYRIKISQEIQNALVEYQYSRINYTQSINYLADNPKNIPVLVKGGVIEELLLLIMDNVFDVQKLAILSLGKISSFSIKYAKIIVNADKELIEKLVFLMQQKKKKLKECAAFLLRSISKHSKKLSTLVALPDVIKEYFLMVESGNSRFRECGLWCILYIVSHSSDISREVLQYPRSASILTGCVTEGVQLATKKIAICVICNIVKHKEEYVKVFIQNNLKSVISKCLDDFDYTMRRHTIALLAQIVKHSFDTAKFVVQSEQRLITKLGKIVLTTRDDIERKNAITCLMVVAKNGEDLGKKIITINHDLLPFLLDALANGECRYQIITMMGYLYSYNFTIFQNAGDKSVGEKKNTRKRTKVIVGEGVLKDAFDPMEYTLLAFSVKTILEIISRKDTDVVIQRTCLNSLKEILRDRVLIRNNRPLTGRTNNTNKTKGSSKRKSTKSRKPGMENLEIEREIQRKLTSQIVNLFISETRFLNTFLVFHSQPYLKKEIRDMAYECIVMVVKKIDNYKSLSPMVKRGNKKMLLLSIRQIGVILKNDKKQRKTYPKTDGFRFLQTLRCKKKTPVDLQNEIKELNTNFPQSVIDYYSPDYEDKLIALIDNMHKKNM